MRHFCFSEKLCIKLLCLQMVGCTFFGCEMENTNIVPVFHGQKSQETIRQYAEIKGAELGLKVCFNEKDWSKRRLTTKQIDDILSKQLIEHKQMYGYGLYSSYVTFSASVTEDYFLGTHCEVMNPAYFFHGRSFSGGCSIYYYRYNTQVNPTEIFLITTIYDKQSGVGTIEIS